MQTQPDTLNKLLTAFYDADIIDPSEVRNYISCNEWEEVRFRSIRNTRRFAAFCIQSELIDSLSVNTQTCCVTSFNHPQ